MELCENNLFIHSHCAEKKNYILDKLNSGTMLFQSLVNFPNEKQDVFIEYVIFDLSEDDTINLVFSTQENPCIEFCKRLAGLYNVNIQLIYYNQGKNYSGEFSIHLHQIVKNEQYGYWQGMYLYNNDLFWETIPSIFKEIRVFQDLNLNLSESDFIELKHQFDKYLLFKQFQAL